METFVLDKMGQFDKCCVKGCKNQRKYSGGNISYFRFPNSPPARKEIWIKFAGRRTFIRKSWKICSSHFMKAKPSQKAGDVDYVPNRNPAKRKPKKKKEKLPDPWNDEDMNPHSIKEEMSDNDDEEKEEDDTGQEIKSVKEGSSRRKGVPRKTKLPSLADTPQVVIKEEPGGSSSDDHGEIHTEKNIEDENLNGGNDTDETIEEKCDETNLDSVGNRDTGYNKWDLNSVLKPTVESESESETSDEEMERRANLRKQQPKPREECPMCDKDFKWPSRLKYHMARVHKDGGNTGNNRNCSECGERLPSKSALMQHIKELHNVPKIMSCVCDFCGRCFSHYSALRFHLLKHTGDRPFQCELCGKTFMRKSVLRTHELRLHGKTKHNSVSCEICGMQFPSMSRCRTHMIKHESTSHECPTCKRTFRYAANLKTHIRGVHEGDTKYECSFCSRRFGNAYNLKVHIRIHTGEKPYICSLCGKGFADICNFRRHEQKCATESNMSLNLPKYVENSSGHEDTVQKNFETAATELQNNLDSPGQNSFIKDSGEEDVHDKLDSEVDNQSKMQSSQITMTNTPANVSSPNSFPSPPSDRIPMQKLTESIRTSTMFEMFSPMAGQPYPTNSATHLSNMTLGSQFMHPAQSQNHHSSHNHEPSHNHHLSHNHHPSHNHQPSHSQSTPNIPLPSTMPGTSMDMLHKHMQSTLSQMYGASDSDPRSLMQGNSMSMNSFF